VSGSGAVQKRAITFNGVVVHYLVPGDNFSGSQEITNWLGKMSKVRELGKGRKSRRLKS